MQARQPTHLFSSTQTMPSSRCWVAPVGQTLTHFGSAQWLQRTEYISLVTWGYFPFSPISTRFQKIWGGRKCSALQANTQALQPMHLFSSIAIPHLIVSYLLLRHTLFYGRFYIL